MLCAYVVAWWGMRPDRPWGSALAGKESQASESTAQVSAVRDAVGRDAAGREIAAGVVLRVSLAEAGFAQGDDLGRVFRHRYVLLHYLGLAVPIFLAFLVFNPTGPLHTPYLPSIGLGIGLMMAMIVAHVRLVCRWPWRRARLCRVLMTPGLVLGAGVLVLAVQVTGDQMGVTAKWSAGHSAIMVAGLALYLEGAAMVILRGPVPRAVAQLRAERKAAAAAHMPPVSLAGPPAVQAADGAAAEGQMPELGDLHRLEAQGNYVLVVTAGGRHVVPGPFAARVARVAEQHGWQVHRSHWVAARAVVAVRRSGRGTVIETSDGAEVPVAGARVPEIRAWVEDAGRGRRLAAAPSQQTPQQRSQPMRPGGTRQDGGAEWPGQGWRGRA